MRFFLSLMILVYSVATYFTAYNHALHDELDKYANLETLFSMAFRISEKLGTAATINSQEFVIIMNETAQKYNANIFRTAISYSRQRGFDINKYILTTDKSAFREHVQLTEGVYPDFTIGSTGFLSSKDDVSGNQTGAVSLISKHHSVNIYPLANLEQRYPMNGVYYVEMNPDQYAAFMESLSIAFEKKGIQTSPGDFYEHAGYSFNLIGLDFRMLPNIALLLTTLLFLSYLSTRTRKVAILHMNGQSMTAILYDLLGPVFPICLLTSCALQVLLCFTTNRHNLAKLSLVSSLFSLAALCGCIYLSVYIFIHKSNLLFYQKRKKNLYAPLGFSFLLKIAVFAMATVFLSARFSYVDQIKKPLQTVNRWNIAEEYAVFENLIVGDNEMEVYAQYNRVDEAVNNHLYPYLNRLGAIYCTGDNSFEGNLFYVNPNYLKRFPLLDNLGNPIDISENENELILLFPSNMAHTTVEKTMDYVTARQKGLSDIEQQTQYALEKEPLQPTFKIIHYDEYDFFTFLPENEYVHNPIIRVLTMENSVPLERASIYGSNIADPLKIYIANQDAQQAYDSLLPILKKHSLDDNLQSLISIRDYFGQLKTNATRGLINALVFLSVGLCTVVFVDIQFLYLYIINNMQYITLLNVSGLSFGARHRGYMLTTVLGWLFNIAICLIFKVSLMILFASSGLLLFECLLTIFLVEHREKRLMLQYLRGA